MPPEIYLLLRRPPETYLLLRSFLPKGRRRKEPCE